MADYTLEQMESDELYFANVMYFEETDSYIGHGNRKIPTCRFCKKSPLVWKKILRKWVLHEQNGDYHDCPGHPLPMDILKEILKRKKK